MAVSNLIYIISSMLIMAIYFNDVLTTEPCTYVSANVVFGKAPSAEPLWSTKVEDFGVCIRSCVRRKPCVSITFDYVTKVCELNRVVLAKEGNRSGKTLMYSALSQWNVDVDPDCFTRPCGEHEVCIPGGLGSSGSGCSYSCLPVAKSVCPVPKVLNGSRTVGSENIVTCPSGYIGGGSATCQHNKQWTSDIQPCEPVYHHPCTSDTICKEINGRCDNQKCTCGIGTYNNTVQMCELDDDIYLISEDNYQSGMLEKSNHTVMKGVLIVKFRGQTGIICDSGWKDDNGVTCRTINSTWNKQSKNSVNLNAVPKIANHVKCEDGEPSFFMCEISGWMHAPDCKKAVTLECLVD